jgi:hypothetical protein
VAQSRRRVAHVPEATTEMDVNAVFFDTTGIDSSSPDWQNGRYDEDPVAATTADVNRARAIDAVIDAAVSLAHARADEADA